MHMLNATYMALSNYSDIYISFFIVCTLWNVASCGMHYALCTHTVFGVHKGFVEITPGG